MTSLHERLIAAAYLVEQFDVPGTNFSVTAIGCRDAVDIHVMSSKDAPSIVDSILAACDSSRPTEWTGYDRADWPWKYQGEGFLGDFHFTILCLTLVGGNTTAVSA